MTPTRVRIFYPADPVGVVPGGIDTFIRGIIKWAPEDLEFSLVGMTTDPVARPLGRWTRCKAGSREFDFFPVVAVQDAGTRGRVPLSVQFTYGAWRHRVALRDGFDVYDFHRLEPSLPYRHDRRPKNAYFHQDPEFVRLSASDSLWRHLPSVNDRIEAAAMAFIDSAWCVRESGVATLKRRYPATKDQTWFIPTWVDAEVFQCVDEQTRQSLRAELANEYALDPKAQWIVTVGRLDTQKDPHLMLKAFRLLREQHRRVAWVIIGDGVLRAELEAAVREQGLEDHVRFVGLMPPSEIADVLHASDLYALSSAYEGMPMALLEALGCGLPAVVTDVGEVRRVVLPGRNGVIAASREAPVFAAALAEGLDACGRWRGSATAAAVDDYHPDTVLQNAYRNYRALGRRRMLPLLGRSAAAARTRQRVIGAPVDLLNQRGVSQRLLQWARAHESRYVCFCNVNALVLASRDGLHRTALEGADHVAPSGAPVVWTLRAKGSPDQERVDGPSTLLRTCAGARDQGIPVGLLGTSDTCVDAMADDLRALFPGIRINFAKTVPAQAADADPELDSRLCDEATRSGIGLLFVGLPTPAQELWMARHKGRIPAVMVGVGSTFDDLATASPRAPVWMRDHGLEWVHRLRHDPRSLWRPYLVSSSVFAARTVREVAGTLATRFKPQSR